MRYFHGSPDVIQKALDDYLDERPGAKELFKVHRAPIIGCATIYTDNAQAEAELRNILDERYARRYTEHKSSPKPSPMEARFDCNYH